MKTLTLLRHAKSGWDDPVQRDFDRPLNAKGKRAAALVGRHLKSTGTSFDHVVASPARRVIETIAEVARGYAAPIEPAWDRRIYLASAATLLEMVHETDDAHDRLLLIGHNPGLEDLVLMLTPDDGGSPRDRVEDKYPTASVAELTFEGSWSALSPGAATFQRFVRPRDLDPTLGPDAD